MEINKQNIDLSGRLVVLGGRKAARVPRCLAKSRGWTCSCQTWAKSRKNTKEMLRNHSIPFEEGQHTEEKILTLR